MHDDRRRELARWGRDLIISVILLPTILWILQVRPAVIIIGAVISLALLRCWEIGYFSPATWTACGKVKNGKARAAIGIGMSGIAIILGLILRSDGNFEKLISELTVPIPDVTLRIVDPSFPGIEVHNQGGETAIAVRYMAALFDLDSADHYQPLPLPSAGSDFIPAGQHETQHPLFLPVARSLKDGDQIFGTIGIRCQNCQRGRTFWVYIVWGKGGWYYQVPGSKLGGNLLPKGNTDMALIADQILKTIPEDKRIPIGEPSNAITN